MPSILYPNFSFFSRELSTLTPIDIYKWMCYKVYGIEDPSQTDQPLLRSSSVAYWKKAISYFMNTTSKWNEVAKTGNPTQSKMINTLIKVVKKCETRGTGAESQTDRAFTIMEFRQLLDLIPEDRYKAMMNFQYHLMGRCDDTAHVKKQVLMASTEFHGYLTTKIVWSKNVIDSQNCPEQILIPSMDTKTCAYLSLATWLEQWIQHGDGALSQWLFCEGTTTNTSSTKEQDEEALNGKRCYARAIKRAIDNQAFEKACPGKLGSHSIRKLSVTEARRQGVSKDDIDYRARWSAKRMQDRYTDIQLNWPDVNAASKLCQDGACRYIIKREAVGVSDEWLCTNVTPNISSAFDRRVGAILARPLLWAAFDPTWSEMVAPEIRHRIISAFIRLECIDIDDGVNPVSRVEVIASEGNDGNALFDYVDRIYRLTRFCLPNLISWRQGQLG